MTNGVTNFSFVLFGDELFLQTEKSTHDTDRRKRGRPSNRQSHTDRPEKVFVTPHPKPSAKYGPWYT